MRSEKGCVCIAGFRSWREGPFWKSILEDSVQEKQRTRFSSTDNLDFNLLWAMSTLILKTVAISVCWLKLLTLKDCVMTIGNSWARSDFETGSLFPLINAVIIAISLRCSEQWACSYCLSSLPYTDSAGDLAGCPPSASYGSWTYTVL